MRNTLKLGLLAMVSLALATLLQQDLQAQNAPKTEQSGAISGAGCVESGVEAGCLVLKDTKSGTLYNLFFTAKKPSPGTAIEFSATVHQGATTCMQGKAVKVKEWKQIRMECKAASK